MKHLYYSDLHPFQTTPTLSLFPFPFISLSLSSSHLCSLPLPTPFYLFLFSSYPLFISQTTNPSQTILSSVLPKLCVSPTVQFLPILLTFFPLISKGVQLLSRQLIHTLVAGTHISSMYMRDVHILRRVCSFRCVLYIAIAQHTTTRHHHTTRRYDRSAFESASVQVVKSGVTVTHTAHHMTEEYERTVLKSVSIQVVESEASMH